MASPISPMEAIQIVNKAITLYKKIRDAPDEVTKVGKRMERLKTYLVGLQQLLSDKKRHSLASLRPTQTEELRNIIEDIEADAAKVYDILQRWDNDIGPFGLQLRFSTVAQALFALGSSTDKLNSLSADIEQHKNDLRDTLQLLGWFGVNALLPGGSTAGKNPNKGRAVSPSPHPKAATYNIIFVDPSNFTNSRVAEAYVKLLQEWTVRSENKWPVRKAISAGLCVRNGSDCIDMLGNIKPPLKLYDGKEKPHGTAMAALFDNGLFDYPYKKEVKEAVLGRTSRGVTSTIFRDFDFVLVFTGRQYENLTRLRNALKAKDVDLVPKGKCRVIHLGSYLSGDDGKPVELVSAPTDKDGKNSRENWNKTVAKIKGSVKVFLKRETGWVQPPLGIKIN